MADTRPAIEVRSTCPRCGWHIRPQADYCAHCGLRLALPALRLAVPGPAPGQDHAPPVRRPDR